MIGQFKLYEQGSALSIPKFGISGRDWKKMESGRDGMGVFNPDFFGTGRDGVFQSRFFRDGTGLKKILIGIPISRFGPNMANFSKAMLKQILFLVFVGSQK